MLLLISTNIDSGVCFCGGCDGRWEVRFYRLTWNFVAGIFLNRDCIYSLLLLTYFTSTLITLPNTTHLVARRSSATGRPSAIGSSLLPPRRRRRGCEEAAPHSLGNCIVVCGLPSWDVSCAITLLTPDLLRFLMARTKTEASYPIWPLWPYEEIRDSPQPNAIFWCQRWMNWQIMYVTFGLFSLCPNLQFIHCFGISVSFYY